MTLSKKEIRDIVQQEIDTHGAGLMPVEVEAVKKDARKRKSKVIPVDDKAEFIVSQAGGKYKKKDADAPKRALSAYTLFCQKHYWDVCKPNGISYNSMLKSKELKDAYQKFKAS